MTSAKPPTRSQAQIALCLTAALFFFFIILSALIMDPRGFDFAGYYTGGLIIHQGNASKLYDVGEQARIERQLFHRKEILINPHPPFEALWFASLARLPYLQAYILWGAINVLLWLLSQYLFWRETPIPRNFVHYCLLPLGFFPLWFNLIIGQTSLVLLFLFSTTYFCLKRGKDFGAGVLLGLGLFRFPIVLPFALICFMRGKWRMMMGFASAASLLGLLSILAVGSAGWRAYLSLLLDILQNPGNPAYISLRAWKQMPNLRGLLYAVLGARWPGLQMGILAVASISLICLVARRWSQGEQRGNSMDLMFAAALTISLVTAPHLYIYDLTLMLLPMLLVMTSIPWREQAVQRKSLLTVVAILSIFPVYLLLLHWHTMYLLAPVLAFFALGAINLAGKSEPFAT